MLIKVTLMGRHSKVIILNRKSICATNQSMVFRVLSINIIYAKLNSSELASGLLPLQYVTYGVAHEEL